MILSLLVNLIFGFLDIVIKLVPEISLPTNILGFLGDAKYLVSFANYFLPIPTILACLTLIFVVDNAKLLISIINWIIAKIPTIG